MPAAIVDGQISDEEVKLIIVEVYKHHNMKNEKHGARSLSREETRPEVVLYKAWATLIFSLVLLDGQDNPPQ